MTQIRFFLLALALLSIPVAVDRATVSAQQGRQLNYGDIVQARLTASENRQAYYFRARRGDVVSVQMTTLNGNLDPLLLLVDNEGRVLAMNDDSDSSLNAVISTVRIPEDSFYFVIVTRYGHALGVTEGEFELQLKREGVLSEAGVYLNYGDSVVGIINRETPRVSYVFEARRGDIINLRMRRISGNLDSYVAISTADGQVLVANDDRSEGGLDAAIEDFLILDPGFYTIVASRFGEESGISEGSYVLTLETAPTSGLGLSMDSALLLRYGDELRGSIDGEHPTHYYMFGAKRGDIVTIAMTRTGGTVDPVITLLNSQGELLQTDDDSGPDNNALLQSYIIPESGTYYVQASRFGGETGTTAGNFLIRLDGISGEAPVVAPGVLTILYGGSVVGSVTDETPAWTYAFLGKGGDRITISMSNTAGDLDPLLYLFTADSVQLAEDDDSGPGKDAQIADFILPRDDIFYIIATRFGLHGGNTTGQFTMSLTLETPPPESSP